MFRRMRDCRKPFLRRAALGLALLVLAAGRAQAQPSQTGPGAPQVAGPSDEAHAFALSASPDPAARLSAVQALARSRSHEAGERLALMAQLDVDPAVRAAAAEGLASTRDPSFAPLLQAIATGDPEPGVRGAAARSAALLTAAGRSPRRAATFSLLCPGCGYFYLGEPGRAAAYLGSTAGLIGAGLGLALGDVDAVALDGPNDGGPSTAPLALPLLTAAQNLWSYGVFASYRDARIARGDEGYRYPISREGLGDLVTASFRPSVLRRPWFWAGLPLMLGAAIGFSALVSPEDFGAERRTLGDPGGVRFLGRRFSTRTGFLLGESYYAGLFLPVGVGEEALFRGVVQPGLTETFGLWPGWAAASILFGAAHIGNFLGEDQGVSLAAKVVPFLTGVGSYLGLVSIKTGFQLETSVALHFWYDFFLGTIGFIADPDNQPFAVRFGLPF